MAAARWAPAWPWRRSSASAWPCWLSIAVFRGDAPLPPGRSRLSERPAGAVPLLRRPGGGRVLWARDADPTAGYDGPAAWPRLPGGVVGLAPPGAPPRPRGV